MADMAVSVEDKSTGFIRGLGLLDSTMIVAGSMIGSGIFIVSADMGRQGVMGHSMGGHGALTVALRNPDRFRAVSAFAPISAGSSRSIQLRIR